VAVISKSGYYFLLVGELGVISELGELICGKLRSYALKPIQDNDVDGLRIADASLSDGTKPRTKPIKTNIWDYLVKGAAFPLVVVFPEQSRVNCSLFLVRWLSGLKQEFTKLSKFNRFRGFESYSHRCFLKNL
jgi:hypothetical protein